MNMMKAARLYGPKDLRMVDLPIPQLKDDQVLCKIVRAGICGTDYSIYTGEFSAIENGLIKFPMTLGHEWSAVVTQTGKNVKNFKEGDRVVGDTCVSCGVCKLCLNGKYNLCPNLRAVGTVNTWDGAYAGYIVMPERHLFHLPDNVSFEQGALIEPAATALYSVWQADVTIGDTVLVHGTGPIGILAAKLAKLNGASKVFITGRKPDKLQICKDFGIDVVINTTNESVEKIVKQHTNSKGVDRIIEASGSTELFKQSFNLIRPGGTISLVAFYERKLDGFDLDKIVFGDISIRPVAGSLGTFEPVLDLMSARMLDATPIITDRCKFEKICEVLVDMQKNNESRIKLMVEYN